MFYSLSRVPVDALLKVYPHLQPTDLLAKEERVGASIIATLMEPIITKDCSKILYYKVVQISSGEDLFSEEITGFKILTDEEKQIVRLMFSSVRQEGNYVKPSTAMKDDDHVELNKRPYENFEEFQKRRKN